MLLGEIISRNLVVDENQLKTDKELLRQTQTFLSELGYMPTDFVTGEFNPSTTAAIVSFCSSHNLNNFLTGKYGATWAKALITDVPPKTKIISKPPDNKLDKYIKDKSYLLCTFAGTHDNYGFKIFLLQLFNKERKCVDYLNVISGTPSAQNRPLISPEKDFAGSGNPIPEGIYKIGKVIKMSQPEKGVGYVKIPVDVLGEFKVNNRSELLLHSDYNRTTSMGSMGCIVTYLEKDMHRITNWCEQKNRPETLVVDYNLGLLRSKGVIV